MGFGFLVDEQVNGDGGDDFIHNSDGGGVLEVKGTVVAMAVKDTAAAAVVVVVVNETGGGGDGGKVRLRLQRLMVGCDMEDGQMAATM
ncbi:hypothetical protein QVD17_00522 [Tagetes erecta]|uniref:Uncharacterized protein n=1 Tax=Tagetes erecta TaxID=13708 RepID=A0AAD8L8T4_TARER|nr:hypothetical protein QVD17_00522 [Tagetes erecta]